MCPKRLIGRQFNPHERYSTVVYGLDVCNVKVESGNGQSSDRWVPGYIVPGNPEKRVTATYVDTLILKHVKKHVEKYLGGRYRVDRAVITIPVAFSWEQRMETYRAAVEAGFTDVSLQQEPVMAAYYYCTQNDITNKQILVYDFGGGTFDLCLIRLKDDTFTILKFDGDDHLGGEDITCSIANLIEYSLSLIFRNWKTTRSPASVASIENAIRAKSEEIKFHLKSLDTEMLEASDFCADWDTTFTIDLHDTKIAQVIDDSLMITHNLLNGESVDLVLLAGGTSNFAIVQKKLQEAFPDKLATDVDPKYCVSMGAAKFGHENPEFRVKKGRMMVNKVLGNSIGWKGKNGLNYIAKKGETLPKEGGMKFRLMEDADHITTQLIEGERVIKELQIGLDKVYPKDTQFLLKLSVNEDLLIYYEVSMLNSNRGIIKLGMVQL